MSQVNLILDSPNMEILQRGLKFDSWDPDVSGLATTINLSKGNYQVCGRVVHILLHIDATDVAFSSDAIKLPIKPLANSGFYASTYYRNNTHSQIVCYDHVADTNVVCSINKTTLQLDLANYSPATGRRLLTISGFYWI